MTKQQEISYLTDLLLQASRWERSEGEVLSGLELEVQDRLRNLLGQNTVDEEGRAQSAPVRLTDEATRERKRRWAAKKYAGLVRVRRGGGKVIWVPREQVDTIQIKTGTGFKYIIKPEFESLYTEPTDGTSPS